MDSAHIQTPVLPAEDHPNDHDMVVSTHHNANKASPPLPQTASTAPSTDTPIHLSTVPVAGEPAAWENAAAETALGNSQGTAVEKATAPVLKATTETDVGNAPRRSGRNAVKPADLPGSSSGQASSSSDRQSPRKKLTQKLTKKPTAPALPLPTLSQPQQAATAPLPPAAAPQPLRITRIVVQPKYDLVSFEAAGTMPDLGLDFGDLRVVGIYNRLMQEDGSSRSIRSQKSLLKVSKMTPEEYFGVNVPLA
jgi:hypothetical protein